MEGLEVVERLGAEMGTWEVREWWLWPRMVVVASGESGGEWNALLRR